MSDKRTGKKTKRVAALAAPSGEGVTAVTTDLTQLPRTKKKGKRGA